MLNIIFDDLNLKSCVSHQNNINSESLKHIFAQAYLGFLFQHATEGFLEKTAFKYFLKDSEKFLPKVASLNPIQVLKAKAYQVLGQKVKFVHLNSESDRKEMFTTQVLLHLEGIIAEHSSVSKMYAKKKAIKNATKYVLDKEAETSQYKLFITKNNVTEQEKTNRIKAEKHKKHLTLIEEKRLKREAEKEIKRVEAKEKEIRRLLNKKGVKNRVVGKQKPAFTEVDLKNMSTAKRRRIEDKLK